MCNHYHSKLKVKSPIVESKRQWVCTCMYACTFTTYSGTAWRYLMPEATHVACMHSYGGQKIMAIMVNISMHVQPKQRQQQKQSKHVTDQSVPPGKINIHNRQKAEGFAGNSLICRSKINRFNFIITLLVGLDSAASSLIFHIFCGQKIDRQKTYC